MSERTGRPTDAELERDLVVLGREIDYPPTPALVPAVRARLVAVPRRLWWARLLAPPGRRALAPLALALVAAALLALWPGALATVAERLGLRGVTIEHVPAAPTPAPTTALAPGQPLGADLRLGERVGLEAATGRVVFRPLRPSLPELGTPDEVYVAAGAAPPGGVAPPAGGQVTFVYAARPGLPAAPEMRVGLLFTQFRGEIDRNVFGKGLGPNTRIEEVDVGAARGVWIEGEAHAFFYRDERGQIRQETLRLAANTLLWEQDGLTLRLESALPRDDALRIATSIR